MAADGPRFDEPVTDRFAPEIPDDLAVNLEPGKSEAIGQALVAASLDLTTAASFIIAAAKVMIKEASAKWPGLPEYLKRTGLGSDPKLIQQLVVALPYHSSVQTMPSS
jgi:hypothetical protein